MWAFSSLYEDSALATVSVGPGVGLLVALCVASVGPGVGLLVDL